MKIGLCIIKRFMDMSIPMYDFIEEWVGAFYQGVDLSWRIEISNHGRLRNAKTKKLYSFGYGANGYLQACVSVNGQRLNVRVHRCVAETFIPNPMGYEIVNHLDGCKQNNRLDNLEWCTRQENYFHAVDHELIDYDVPAMLGHYSHMGMYVGSWNGMAKLVEADVRYIREVYIPKGKGSKCNRKELAEQFSVSVGLISQIVKREIWTHIE